MSSSDIKQSQFQVVYPPVDSKPTSTGDEHLVNTQVWGKALLRTRFYWFYWLMSIVTKCSRPRQRPRPLLWRLIF